MILDLFGKLGFLSSQSRTNTKTVQTQFDHENNDVNKGRWIKTS